LFFYFGNKGTIKSCLKAMGTSQWHPSLSQPFLI
jgi:hypothetical protein